MFSPLNLRLQASPRFYGAHLLFATLASIALVLSQLDPFSRFTLFLVVLAGLGLALRGRQLQLIRHLSWNLTLSQMEITDLSGQCLQCAAPLKVLVYPQVIFIKVQPQQRLLPRWIILLPDMVEPAQWRRLQVAARWCQLAEAPRNQGSIGQI